MRGGPDTNSKRSEIDPTSTASTLPLRSASTVSLTCRRRARPSRGTTRGRISRYSWGEKEDMSLVNAQLVITRDLIS